MPTWSSDGLWHPGCMFYIITPTGEVGVFKGETSEKLFW